jgi:hypothetical protein
MIPSSNFPFVLLEYLLDVAIDAVSENCLSAPIIETTPSVIRNNQERIQLEIEQRKWNFEKYFLVWSSYSLLHILKANLKMLPVCGTPPGAVGLASFSPENYRGGALVLGGGTENQVKSFPVICRLLRITVEFIGGGHLPNGRDSDSRLDIALGSSSVIAISSTVRDDQEDYHSGRVLGGIFILY